MKQPQMYMACFTLVALNQIHAHSGVGPASHDHSGKAVKNVAAGTAAMPLKHKVKSAPTPAPKASAMAENSTKIEVKAHVGKKKKQKMANAVAIMQLGVPQSKNLTSDKSKANASQPAKPHTAPSKAEAASPKVSKKTNALPSTPLQTKSLVAVGAVHSKMASATTSGKPINPPLKDVVSDKKFFGPPFPADYPDDKRPSVQKSILDKLKGPEQPYPALQSKATYDRDYVKDENGDKGHWKAQFEYDALRNKIAKEEAEKRRAEERAAKEGRDVDGAQRDSDKAGQGVDDAKRGLDDAKAGEENARKGGDGDGSAEPSKEALDALKKRLKEAEANYEKEKKEFEECKKNLEETKKQLEDLKAKQAEMEKSLASDTKLWVENKAYRLNAKKAREDAAASKVKSAQQHLVEAQKIKSEMDEKLAVQKFEHEQAQKKLREHKAKVEEARHNLEKATLVLRKLRGHAPAEAEPLKSNALALSVSALLMPMAIAMNF